MFKNATLGKRIGLGFGALLLLTVLLSGVGLVAMTAVRGQASTLSQHYLPTLESAANVQRHWLMTLYQMRGYTLVYDPKYKEQGLAELSQVAGQASEAVVRAQRAGSVLASAKQSAETAGELARQYQALIEQTSEQVERIQSSLQAMGQAANKVYEETAKYRTAQRELAQQDAAAGSGGEAMLDRLDKTAAIADVDMALDSVRIAVWRSSATRDLSPLAKADGVFDDIAQKLDGLLAVTRREANRTQLNVVKGAAAAYRQRLADYTAAWKAAEELRPQREAIGAQLLEATTTMADASIKQSTAVAQRTSGSLSRTVAVQTVGLLVGLVLGVLLAGGITRSICGPLRRIVSHLSQGSAQVSAASNEVAGSSQQLAQGASEQAAALEETSASLEEIAAAAQSNEARTAEISGLAGDCLRAASAGNDAMHRMSDAMGRVQASSEETSRILKTIDGIAFQTNLLALNAAVEAARAGAAGQGFAVVADEVRALAARSAEAAAETTQLLERARTEAEAGVAAVGAMGDTLERLTNHAARVVDVIAEVHTASTETTRAVHQVTGAVSQIDQVTQGCAANAEEAASASEELSAQSRELDDMVRELEGMIGGGSAGDQPVPTVGPVPPVPIHVPPALRLSSNGHSQPEHSHSNGHLS